MKDSSTLTINRNMIGKIISFDFVDDEFHVKIEPKSKLAIKYVLSLFKKRTNPVSFVFRHPNKVAWVGRAPIKGIEVGRNNLLIAFRVNSECKIEIPKFKSGTPVVNVNKRRRRKTKT